MNVIEARFLANIEVIDDNNEIYEVSFFTKDMHTNILDCKADLFKLTKNTTLKNIISSHYKKKLAYRMKNSILKQKTSLLHGDIMLVKIDRNGEVEGIYDLDPFEKNISTEDLIKELYFINKNFIHILQKCKDAPIQLDNQIFYSGYELYNKLIKVLDKISVESSVDGFSLVINTFMHNNDKDIDYIEELLFNISKDIAIICIENDFNLKNYLNLNYKLNQVAEHIMFFKKLNNLLCELIRILDINIEFEKYIEVNGQKVNISVKELKKSNVKAHIRRIGMSNEKREKVLCFLEENNLTIDGLGLITKDNFNDFDWSQMTIIDSFEKNINCIKYQDNLTVEDYIDKEIEKQKKLCCANLTHQKLVRQMAYCINKNGFEPKYNKFIDLYFESKESAVIFEMKSINESNCYSQLMKAFSQLMIYPYICNLDKDIEKCIVLSEKPKETRFESLFKDSNINVVWIENDTFNTYAWSNNIIVELLLNQVIILN